MPKQAKEENPKEANLPVMNIRLEHKEDFHLALQQKLIEESVFFKKEGDSSAKELAALLNVVYSVESVSKLEGQKLEFLSQLRQKR